MTARLSIFSLFILFGLVRCASVTEKEILPDRNPPVIKSTSYPSSVVAGSTFTIFLTMTDQSDIIAGDTSYMHVREASVGNYIACTADNLKLVNGTASDGVFSLSCLVPIEAPNDPYSLEIHISDEYSNQVGLNIPNAFVLTGGSQPDLDPPKVTSMTLSDTEIERGGTLGIQLHAVDKQTGVQSVEFQVAENYFTYIVLCRGEMTLVNGDGFSGDWTASCVIPADASYSGYTVSAYPVDGQNNQGYSYCGFKVV